MHSIEIHSIEEFRLIVHELQEKVQQSYAFLHRAAQAGVSPGEIEQEIENAQKAVAQSKAVKEWTARYPRGLPPPPPAPHPAAAAAQSAAPASSSSRVAAAAPVPTFRRKYTEKDFYYQGAYGKMHCKLCNREADQGHVNSKMHENRINHPEYYLDA